MVRESLVLGVFPNEEKVLAALAAMSAGPWKVQHVHSPVPSPRLMEALGVKKSPVGHFTLAGGIIGFLSGFALAIFAATRWNLIVWGKPVISLLPFVIVGFEFTILFSVIGNVLGLIFLANLPDYQGLRLYDPRFSGEHYGILARCPPEQDHSLRQLFETNGGEARVVAE